MHIIILKARKLDVSDSSRELFPSSRADNDELFETESIEQFEQDYSIESMMMIFTARTRRSFSRSRRRPRLPSAAAGQTVREDLFG